MDVITIRGMRVMGKHGVHAEEKEREQPFDIDLDVELDLSRAATSDALSDTLDYAELHARITRLVTDASFNLLERLASEIVRLAFQDERVRRASVWLRKPDLLGGATAGIRLTRER